MWECALCGEKNEHLFPKCTLCGQINQSMEKIKVVLNTDGGWICPKPQCKKVNQAKRNSCFSCKCDTNEISFISLFTMMSSSSSPSIPSTSLISSISSISSVTGKKIPEKSVEAVAEIKMKINESILKDGKLLIHKNGQYEEISCIPIIFTKSIVNADMHNLYNLLAVILIQYQDFECPINQTPIEFKAEMKNERWCVMINTIGRNSESPLLLQLPLQLHCNKRIQGECDISISLNDNRTGIVKIII